MVIDSVRLGDRSRRIGWHAVTLLLLLAFALQSYLAQTHIHETSGTLSQTCVSKCVVHLPLSHFPFGEAADCPLCQAVVHAGAFFAPAILAVIALCQCVEFLISARQDFAPRTASVRHGLSRAPPLN
jgi:hypothetical protein